MKIKSLNNSVMVKPYKIEKKLKARISSGFATPEQKTAIVPLEVLADSLCNQGNNLVEIEKGDLVLVREEDLYTQKHLQQQYNLDKQRFSLIPYQYIVGMVKTKKETGKDKS